MRPDVQSVVRWGLPVLLVCAASGCGSASSGAPIDTPPVSVSTPVSVSAPVAASVQLADTTSPTPVTALDVSPSTSAQFDPVSSTSSPPEALVTVASPPPTTAPAVSALETLPPPPEVSDASVLALAAVLGVDGEVEHMEGCATCIGRLEPRGLCVNGPIPGAWQYWDLDAQNSAGASDEEAGAAALDVFTRIGVGAGVVMSVEPNGPLPQVTLSNGALVMVAEGGRIASIIAGIDQLPSG